MIVLIYCKPELYIFLLHVMRAGLANKDGLYILKLVLFTFPTTIGAVTRIFN